ncbi:hypothetical protein EDB81DRAFT_785341 [Dactylonectria macrodidyma]|uniref:G domain-containing protein n=1 Tax=Dactylonectria macrodidyma TaxID=307937 RepID=A0A9P9FGP8_9HYPO|nr:hypothetical protein EDB81DRAFT_785341 [Dactylonectria macrodidyma]
MEDFSKYVSWTSPPLIPTPVATLASPFAGAAPVDRERSPSPVDHERSSSPVDHERNSSLVDHEDQSSAIGFPSSKPEYHGTFESPFAPSDKDVFIAIMGMTGAGKSTFISHCTDEEVKISPPGALESCTQEVRVYRCRQFAPHANVYLVDTPGFDDTNRNDTEILKEIASWLTQTYQNKVRLRGILYLHRISDNRMTGCARRNLVMFKRLCGTDGVKSVIFLTTFWESVEYNIGEDREKTLKETKEFWGYFVNLGAQVNRHLNNHESAISAIAEFVPGRTDRSTEEMKMAIQSEMVDSRKQLDETGAGQQLRSEFQKESERLQQEMKEREQDMKEALEMRDKELMDVLRQEQDKQEADLERYNREIQDLRVTMESMHQERIQRLEDRLRDHEKEKQQHIEQIQTLHKEHRDEIQRIEDQRSKDKSQYESRLDSLIEEVHNLRVAQDQTNLTQTPSSSAFSRPHPSPDILSRSMRLYNGKQWGELIRILEPFVMKDGEELADDDFDRLRCYVRLAGAYVRSKRAHEAIQLLEPAVPVWERIFPEENRTRLSCQFWLARAYQEDKQMQKAIPIFETVVFIESRTRGRNDSKRLDCLYWLARAHQANGDTAKAIAMFEDIVAIESETLADNDHKRLNSQFWLAKAYQKSGDNKKAIPLYEKVVSIESRTLEEDNSDRLNSQSELAKAYEDNGEMRKAIPLLEAIVSVKKRTVAKDDPVRVKYESRLAKAKKKYENRRRYYPTDS